MGYEYIRQPQIFTRPISALGGIHPYVTYPQYRTAFTSWNTTTTTNTTVFSIPGTFPILEKSESFIVNVSGVVQAPNKYTVNRDFRTITFTQAIPASTLVSFTQIGTIALDTATYVSLTSQEIIVNANSATDAVKITQKGTGNALRIEDSTSDTTPFIITNNGNVGIGTITPTQKLHVNGSIALQGTTNTLLINYLGTQTILSPDASDWGTSLRLAGSSDTYPNTAALYVNGNIALYSDNNRDIGIGTANPVAKLHVSQSSTDPAIKITQSGTGHALLVEDTGSVDATPFVINTDGKVGIGTTTPAAGLHLAGTALNDNGIIQDATSTYSPYIIQKFPSSIRSTNTNITIYDQGNENLVLTKPSHSIVFNKTTTDPAYYYWVSTNTSPTAEFVLAGTNNLFNESEAYVVTVGGLLQPADSYTVNPTKRRITFVDAVSAEEVYVFQTVRSLLSGTYANVTLNQWITSSRAATSSFYLTGSIGLSSTPEQYVVGVGGILQLPTEYSINTINRTINFTSSVPPSTVVTVSFLPSAVSTTSDADIQFLSTFKSWTTSSYQPITVLPLTGTIPLLGEEAGFIVNVGGVLQTPNTYSVDRVYRTITFSSPIPRNAPVGVTQLAAPYFPIVYSTQFNVATGGTSTAAARAMLFLDGKYEGRVGIKTTTPRATLDLGPTTGNKLALWSDADGQYGLGINSLLLQIYSYWGRGLSGEIAFGIGDNITFNELARIKSLSGVGHLGIGTSSPVHQLQLSKDSAAKPSTSTWAIASDERIKENIILADNDRCYEIVKTLPLKRYTWKSDVYTPAQVPDRSKLGWIAQDVQAVFPKGVAVSPLCSNNIVIEDCLTLNTDQIYASMYGALQQLITVVETQSQTISALETRIQILES